MLDVTLAGVDQAKAEPIVAETRMPQWSGRKTSNPGLPVATLTVSPQANWIEVR